MDTFCRDTAAVDLVPASQREGGATLGSVVNHTYTDGKDNDLINWLPNQLAHNLEKRATLMQLEAFVSEYISSNEWRCVVQLIYIQNLPFPQILPTTDSFFVGTDSVLASFLLNISVVVFSFIISFVFWLHAFSALTLLVGRQEGHPACKNWGAGMVICLERGADLHMAQLMPLPLTVSCFSEIQIGFFFLLPAHPGSPGQRAIKRVCVYVFRLRVGV